MVTLKQITSFSTSQALSNWYESVTGQQGFGGRGSLVSPTYPIVIFDYQTSSGTGVAYITGSNLTLLEGGTDADYLTTPGLYLTALGYNQWIGGGGVYGASGCMQNGNNKSGPWWAIVNIPNNTLNAYCSGLIPNNPIGTDILGILADLVNQNILIVENTTNNSYVLIWIVPFNQVSILLSNQAPSSMEWVYIQSSQGTNITIFTSTPTIYSGNLILSAISTSTAYIWVIPLSSIYSSAVPGSPSSTSSPVTLGSTYTLGSLAQSSPSVYNMVSTVIGVPTSSGLSVYVSIAVSIPFYTIQVWDVSPSNWSVVGTQTFTTQQIIQNFTKATWNSTFLFVTASPPNPVPVIYLVVIDPKTMSMETTNVNGYLGIATSEGYLVVATTQPNISPVNWTIYQILADHTYVFQNVSINISGNTVTATGTLYDLSTNSAVAGATVYLVAVASLSDQYSDDIVIIASGTTNSNGQFSISGSLNSSYKWYGVLYVP